MSTKQKTNENSENVTKNESWMNVNISLSATKTELIFDSLTFHQIHSKTVVNLCVI